MAYTPLGGVGGGSAQDIYANLTRSQWGDYLNNIGVPQENKLIQYATDPATVSNAMAEASSDVNGAFDRQADATTRRLSSLGLTLNPEEQAASTRGLGLARSLADVQAQNQTRDQTRARQQAIIGGAPAARLSGLGG